MKIEWSNIKRIIEGHASSKELSDFEAWLEESEANRDYFEEINNYYSNPILAEKQNSLSARSGKGGINVIKQVNRQRIRRRLIVAFSSAASIIIAFMVAYPLLDSNISDTNTAIDNISVNRDIILPGGVILKAENKNIDEDIDIDKSSSEIKEISYMHKVSKNNVINYHTISTPTGKNFSVVLSDGTTVHLNAQSELRYPTSFENCDLREVYLTGEGYFDVIKSKNPFVVKVNGVNVRVYGTKFNINAYDSTNVEAVLLSGSIGVTLDSGSDFTEKLLSPNQMANISTKDKDFKFSVVDPQDYLSWKDGVIKSYNSTLGDLVFKLEKWYGVTFIFADVKNTLLPITASFNSSRDVEEIISAIEYILNLKIQKMEGGYTVK